MSLRLRALQLRALTADGEFGRDLHFDDGLVVLRAENSMGKTTATSSVLYALGMEGLIAQAQRVPLPPVMTSRLIGADNRELAVAESRVLLEVENHHGDVLTFERYAKRQQGDTRLVRVWSAPRITAPSPDDRYEELLARVVGSGSGELGVGPRLARFVGWDLPSVLMPDGAERRLYPELVLPLMFVEQRGGWRGIQAGMPSTYGIPDLRKRVREFVLGLGVYERERERLALRREADAIRSDWEQTLRLAGARLNASGLRLSGVATAVELDFGADTPLLVVDLTSGRPLDAERAQVEQELEALKSPAEDQDHDPAEGHEEDEQTLAKREAQLHTAVLDLRERERRIARQRGDLGELEVQKRRLEEDLGRNQDARRLQSFGGEQPWADDERDCPTCHQALPPTLLGELDRPAMTLEQNIEFIRQQVELVDAGGCPVARRT